MKPATSLPIRRTGSGSSKGPHAMGSLLHDNTGDITILGKLYAAG